MGFDAKDWMDRDPSSEAWRAAGEIAGAEAMRGWREKADADFARMGEVLAEHQRREGRQKALAARNVEEEIEEREERAEDRVAAAEDRARAAEDRAQAAEDREQAARERAQDRERAAEQRVEDQATATSRFRWQMAVVIVGALISASGVVIALTKDTTVNVQPPVVNVPAPVVTVVAPPPELPPAR